MGKQRRKVKNGGVWITKRLDKFERVNTEELKVLVNGTVAGLLPVSVDAKGKKCTLTVALSNQTALADFCAARMETGTILNILCGTLQIAAECERFGLRPDSLCWSMDCVFLDQRGRIHMLYWPVLCLGANGPDMLSFYRGFLEYMYRDSADPQVTDAFARYFYQRDRMNLLEFRSAALQIRDTWRQKQSAQTLEMQSRHQRAAAYDTAWDAGQSKGNAWLESAADKRKIWLNRDEIVFGRSRQDCDVTIQRDESVSRRHARILKQGERYMVEDLGSTNGSYVNQNRLSPRSPVTLEDGDQVRFGDSGFTFHTVISEPTVCVYPGQGG